MKLTILEEHSLAIIALNLINLSDPCTSVDKNIY